MNEYTCNECNNDWKSNAEHPACPNCHGNDVAQTCPMCGSIIDEDTKVCPECKEAVA